MGAARLGHGAVELHAGDRVTIIDPDGGQPAELTVLSPDGREDPGALGRADASGRSFEAASSGAATASSARCTRAA